MNGNSSSLSTWQGAFASEIVIVALGGDLTVGKGEKLSRRSIQKIADFLGVNPELLMKEVSDNKILQP